MKLSVRNVDGKEVRQVDVDESVFGIQPNVGVLHQAYLAQRANQRSGNASTKGRGEVAGSTRKMRMQKYTGRARAGSNRAPTRVGGGIAFGPKPRDYSQALNKKMRRLAIRSALSGKAAGGQLVVIDQLALETPKTKEVIRLLRNVGLERSVLIVTGQPDRTVRVSARNLEKTKVLPAAYLNVVDMMHHQGLVMTEDAVRVAESLWGKRAPEAEPEAKPARRAKAAPEAEATTEVAAAKPARAPRARKAEAPPAETAAEVAPKPARARRTAEAEAPAVESTAGAPKPARARRPAKAEAPVAETTAEAPKPARARRPAKAQAPAAEATTDEAAKPARRPRAPKAEAPAAETAAAPKPKRRTPKKTEGEE